MRVPACWEPGLVRGERGHRHRNKISPAYRTGLPPAGSARVPWGNTPTLVLTGRSRLRRQGSGCPGPPHLLGPPSLLPQAGGTRGGGPSFVWSVEQQGGLESGPLSASCCPGGGLWVKSEEAASPCQPWWADAVPTPIRGRVPLPPRPALGETPGVQPLDSAWVRAAPHP